MSISWLLRTLPAMTGELARFDLDRTPAEPRELFLRWFGEAVAAGVREPHAMNLATVDEGGLPDVRVLLLREVDERGWHFATDRRSAKGRQLTAGPQAALGFYWPEQGRQIRVRGKVFDLGLAAAAADFLSRSPTSRTASLSSVQSDVLADLSDVTLAMHEAERLLAEDPDFVPESHVMYALAPVSVEFWQGEPASRRHPRLRYRRSADSWVKEALWP
ncbi:pyridoxamine 5'-phosphate oxidase [Actinoplanes cyaneus]|uniref:Pyridoxamine 5'-phosphate oxidase n=1 Tax=Actinoplanes cyaneus TaxID=52696 RepID=A0A919M9T4_9ACTN|nr:pyridoxal 5'-phosphate synthase [Actinoplanes cyaneus]MCW2137313.1 Pyridoxamine 5'-phosphate oxidase [Actinoplanes cyaneus]GID63366.1 pyridoxamine 5'-phosphate oxidase [Actinoplanes cyaneus]